MNRRSFFLALAIVLATHLSAQVTTNSRYSFRLDTASLLLGDQIILCIEDPDPFPSMDDLSNNGMLAVSQEFDTATKTLYTAMTSFEPGEHWLHVGADSVLLTVNDVEGVDTVSADIKDITAILRQPYTFWEIFRWVLLAPGVAGLIVGGIFLYRRSKEKKLKTLFIPKPSPPLPPHERALKALEALRTRQLWQQGLVKEFYTELTDIVRRYLEEAFGIPSVEMTSEQTLDYFKNAQVYTPELYNLLHQMLDTADRVKFAKSEPLPHQHDFSLSNAVEFVHQAHENNKIKSQQTSEILLNPSKS